MTSGGNYFNHFAENQLTKFNARDAGDFNDAAGDGSKIGMLTVNRLTGLAVLKARPVFKLPVWLTVP